MTRLKWFTSLIGFGLLLAGAALFLFRSTGPSVVPPSAPDSPVAPVAAASPEAEKFRAGLPMKRVMDLYEAESQRIGQVDPDPALTQERLKIAAAELNPEELLWLEGQATDLKTEADARFFATYLLGLSGKKEAIASLTRIALRPIPELKNKRQMDELRVQQMQVTEALSYYCEFSEATDSLLDIVDKQSDETIRDRAHRALHACRTGKPVEEQDKDALRKVQEGKGR